MPIVKDVFAASLRGLVAHLNAKHTNLCDSLELLPNPESDYAMTHYELLNVLDDLMSHIDRCINAGKAVDLGEFK